MADAGSASEVGRPDRSSFSTAPGLLQQSTAASAAQAKPDAAGAQKTLTDEQIAALKSPSNVRPEKINSIKALQGSASRKLLQKSKSKTTSSVAGTASSGQQDGTAADVEAPRAASAAESGAATPAAKKVVKKPVAKPPPATAAAATAVVGPETGGTVEAGLTATASPPEAAAAEDAAPDTVAAPKAAAKPTAAPKPAAAAAAESAAGQTASTPAHAKPPAVKKPPRVPVAAASSAVAAAAAPAAPAASAAVASPAVSHVGNSSSHGSSTSRRLQALLAEGSALCVMDAVLSAEGSELPGSRPPAQLHGTLDGNGGDVDKEEEQEIQKIISEIHGGGDDSEDDPEPPRVSMSKRSSTIGAVVAAAAHATASTAAAAAPAIPSSLLVLQQQPASDAVEHAEQSAAGAQDISSQAGNEDCAAAAAEADGYNPQDAEEAGLRASPWPDETQIKRELLEQNSSSGEGASANSTAAAAAAGSLTARSAAAAAAAALAAAVQRASATGVLVDSNEQTGYGSDGGVNPGFATDGDMMGADDERSRAIVEQLAQLHEESRRLQLQSQVLQQRAIEMSLQMVADSSPVNPGQQHQDLNSMLPGPHHTQLASSGIVQLSHVSELGNLHPMLGQGSAVEGLANRSTGSGGLVEVNALGLGARVLPRHPLGDSTPSSVTSSRAGLNWSIPSRSGIPSPGKADSRGYSPAPVSAGSYASPAGASRPNPHSHSYMQANSSVNYQMYSYTNSSRESVSSMGPGGTPITMTYIKQQQQQQPYQHQQQQHLHHPSYDVDAAGAGVEAAAMLPGSQLTVGSGAAAHAGVNRQLRSVSNGPSQSGVGQHIGQSNATVVRKSPLPFKATAGVTTTARVAAAGATAGRRSSCDAGRATADDVPAIGTFAAAHAVHGAAGAAVQSGGGRLSPRPGGAAAVDAARATAKQAGSSSSSKSKAAAPGAAAGVVHGSRTGPTAAALAAAAGRNGKFNNHFPAAAAVPWGPMVPYAGALYGPYGAVNPANMTTPQAMVTMMMKQQQQHSPNNKPSKGIASKLNPTAAAGPWVPGMPMALPPGFMPAGVPMQGLMSAPGVKGLGNKGSGVYGGTAGNYGVSNGTASTGKSPGSHGHGMAVRPSAMAPPAMMLPFGMPVMPGMPSLMSMAAQMPPVSYSLHAGKGQGGAGSQHMGEKAAAAAVGLAAVPPGFMPAGPWGMPGMAAPGMYGAGIPAAALMQQQQQQGGRKGGGSGAARGGNAGGKAGWAS